MKMNYMERSLEGERQMNGAPITRRGDAIFVPLPPSLWRPAGVCACPYCEGQQAYWDTVAVATKAPKKGADTAYTVHYPELHSKIDYAIRRGKASDLRNSGEERR